MNAVCDTSPPNNGGDGRVRVIAQAAGPANLIEWAKLALREPKTPVLRIMRVRHDETRRPLSSEEVVLALDCFPGLADDNAPGVQDIGALALRYRLALERATERITMVPASKEVAHHLKVEAGASLVKLDRVSATKDGQPLEWRVAYTLKA